MRILFLCSVILLSGCATAPSPVGLFHDQFYPSEAFANYVQWNNQYAVTVKNAPGVYSSYDCSSGCDLSFVWHPVPGQTPVWSEVGPEQSVTIMGYGADHALQEVPGKDLDEMIDLYDNGKIIYHLTSSDRASSMPGAAVLDNGGNIVGMNVGRISPKNAKLAPSRSAYIPYREVKRQWNKYLAARNLVTMR